jgi:hypothetical protein
LDEIWETHLNEEQYDNGLKIAVSSTSSQQYVVSVPQPQMSNRQVLNLPSASWVQIILTLHFNVQSVTLQEVKTVYVLWFTIYEVHHKWQENHQKTSMLSFKEY